MHHYLNQKDIAILVIEKEMLSRQASLQSQFIKCQPDPMIIARKNESGESEIISYNESAQKLFKITD